MKGQTELLLEALGQTDLTSMLSVLVSKPATEAQLTRELGLSQTAATRGLKHLRMVGLIDRDTSRSSYHSTFPGETRAILDAADALADLVVAARAARDARLRELRMEQSPETQR
jgi:DNA-binding IclR family transcriptional regulator